MIKLQLDEHQAMADYIYSLCAITLDSQQGLPDREPVEPPGGRTGLSQFPGPDGRNGVARAGWYARRSEPWRSWM